MIRAFDNGFCFALVGSSQLEALLPVSLAYLSLTATLASVVASINVIGLTAFSAHGHLSTAVKAEWEEF